MGSVPTVFFDLDGTLADSARGIVASLENALAACAIPSPDVDWLRFIGPPLPRMLEAALPKLRQSQRDDVIAAYRQHYASTGLFETSLFPGVEQLLRGLADDGWQMYIVTNKPQAPAEAIVAHLKLGSLVRRVIGGDPSGRSTKPDRAAALVETEGLAGGVFVGDGLDDLHAAERIAARFFLASWGYGTAHVLADRPDVRRLHHPTDLLSAIELDPHAG
jgi:phosphoglycolate phosphatase